MATGKYRFMPVISGDDVNVYELYDLQRMRRVSTTTIRTNDTELLTQIEDLINRAFAGDTTI